MEIVPDQLSVEDLGELVYAWEFPGVVGNAWNGEPGRSIAIGSSCIWGEFIFLATRRLGDCMEKLLECLRNPRRKLGIVMVCNRLWNTVKMGIHGAEMGLHGIVIGTAKFRHSQDIVGRL
eukprot:Gb_09774 [translate_table: standard]